MTHSSGRSQSCMIIKQRNQKWIEVYVHYHQRDWIQKIKNIHGRVWQPEQKCWLLPYVKATFYQLRDEIKLSNIIFKFKIEAKIPDVYIERLDAKEKIKDLALPLKFQELREAHQNAIFDTVKLLTLSRYSYSTINAYRKILVNLFYTYKYIQPTEIKPDHVSSYLFEKIKKHRISASSQNQIINAYKVFAEKILKRPKEFIEIPRPRKARKLPGILSANEVVRLINSPTNLKHKLILLLTYSAGLRVSEVVNILCSSLQVDRRVIHIKDGKGRKDRYVVLADSVLPYLKKYQEEYKPQRWLFEGLYGERYSPRSVQNVFARALKKSKINSHATMHTLRHSYATHCLENGHNLKSVQEALGHNSLKTTELYLHLTSEALRRLKSPLDEMKFN